MQHSFMSFHIIINISLNMVEALECICLHFQSTNSIFKIYTQKLKLCITLNFRIFAKNGKTLICFYLLNRAR